MWEETGSQAQEHRITLLTHQEAKREIIYLGFFISFLILLHTGIIAPYSTQSVLPSHNVDTNIKIERARTNLRCLNYKVTTMYSNR